MQLKRNRSRICSHSSRLRRTFPSRHFRRSLLLYTESEFYSIVTPQGRTSEMTGYRTATEGWLVCIAAGRSGPRLSMKLASI